MSSHRVYMEASRVAGDTMGFPLAAISNNVKPSTRIERPVLVRVTPLVCMKIDIGISARIFV
jgi:hypothetical protein